MMSRRNLCIVLLFCMLLGGCAEAHQGTISVSGLSDLASIDVPVEVKPGAIAKSVDIFSARSNTSADSIILFQKTPSLFYSQDRDLDSTYVAVLFEGTTNGTYQVTSTNEGPAFSFVDNDGQLLLKEGDQPVLAYNYGMQLEPGVPERYRRSTYIHPIWDMQGRVITDDFPEHYHHRGLSWMWPRVVVDGQTYDLWAIEGVRQIFEKWLVREVGPVCATIGVKNTWQLEDGRKVMDEWVWIRAFRATEAGRAIDIRLTLEASDQPVQLLGRANQNKGYGGLSFRFAPREETVIATPKGVQAEDSNHKHFPWVDMSGMFGGLERLGGAAIFQHGSHPDFPAQWTIRHYGFLGVAWPGNEGTTLQPGEPVTLRYRIWIHRDDAEAGRVAEAYEAFQNPPVLHVTE